MAYASGDLILRDHYNTFATGSAAGTANHAVANVNTVWGVGNGNKGYGQSSTLSAVAAGDVVTATQWSTLIARLNSALTHQAGTGSGITAPTSGDLIAYLAALSGKVTDAFNNRLNFNSIRGAGSTTNYDGVWSAGSPTSFTQTRTITFASGDAARYFFNGGGQIGLTLSVAAGGSDNPKESAWTTLLSQVGTVEFMQTSSPRTGTGGTLTTDGSAIGYYDLTVTDQTLIKLTSLSANYTANYVEVLARSNGVQGANADAGSVITFTINYVDGAADSTYTADDQISMTVRAGLTITPPETTNLTATWGTVTPATTLN